MTEHTSNDEKRHPKPLEEGFERVLTPFQEFINDQRTGSVLLLVCTLSALLIANSPLAHDYEALVEMPVGFVFGELSLTMSVRHWINDGLLSLFFFVLGLEIKREILVGEFGCRRPGVYFLGGAMVWLAMLGSGVHATIAGVLVAMTIPARPKREPQCRYRRRDSNTIGANSRPVGYGYRAGACRGQERWHHAAHLGCAAAEPRLPAAECDGSGISPVSGCLVVWGLPCRSLSPDSVSRITRRPSSPLKPQYSWRPCLLGSPVIYGCGCAYKLSDYRPSRKVGDSDISQRLAGADQQHKEPQPDVHDPGNQGQGIAAEWHPSQQQ